MKNRYSPIPSFLSIKFDSDLKLDNLNFIRVFNSNKGTIGIVKENDSYNWRADNFPLDELELSLNKNQFDRIDGIINGEGSISSDQTYLDGRIAWSLGKYGNINLAMKKIEFTKMHSLGNDFIVLDCTKKNLQVSKKLINTVEASTRLDAIASAGFRVSRTKIIERIENGMLRLNGSKVHKPTINLKIGDKLELENKGFIEILNLEITKRERWKVKLLRK